MYHGGTPIWRFHTGLCKFLRNISTHIWSLGERTGLKLGEKSYFFIFYNITISQLFPVDSFRFIFLCRDSENDLFSRQLISSVASYFTSFVYPLRLAIFRTEIFAFVDCFRPLSDRLGDFARSSRSHFKYKRKSKANVSSMPSSSFFLHRSLLPRNYRRL